MSAQRSPFVDEAVTITVARNTLQVFGEDTLPHKVQRLSYLIAKVQSYSADLLYDIEKLDVERAERTGQTLGMYGRMLLHEISNGVFWRDDPERWS